MRIVRAAFILSSIVIGTLFVSAQSNSLRLVSTVWPPFTNEPGQPRFALDLVETALSRLGLTSKTTIVDAAQFTPALLEGEFDGSAAAWRDPDRDRVLLFSQPYLENRLILVGRKGSDVSATKLSALNGKRIAVVGGYAYGTAVDEASVTVVRSRSEEDSLSLLLAGSADYALMDDLVVQYITSNYAKEAQSKLELGTLPLVTRQLHLAIRKSRPDAQSIIDRFNSQLRGLIADRTYHKLLHVAWIRADVDGDGIPEFVPATDRPGPTPPQHAYSLFSPQQPTLETPASETSTKPRFYVGGNIYTDWATIPSRYKVEDQKHPDSRRSTASIFRFSW
jgi:polar amino acid transport system substrate-binding protein